VSGHNKYPDVISRKSSTSKAPKLCRECMHFEARAQQHACTHAETNIKHAPYLVDGTHIACLTERENLAGPCGTSGKLYESASAEDLADRRTRTYFHPPV